MDGFTFIRTDVRKKEEVEKAFEIVKESGFALDAIISEAGVNELNSLLEISHQRDRHQRLRNLSDQ